MHPKITNGKKWTTKQSEMMNQLKHNGVDDELRNSTHSNNVMTAMKKHMKGLKDPTI